MEWTRLPWKDKSEMEAGGKNFFFGLEQKSPQNVNK